MPDIEEQEELDSGEEEETEGPAPEPEVPQNQNDPIEVETDESRRESRKAKRAERQSQFRAAQEEAARLRAEVEALKRQPAYQPPTQQQQSNPHIERLRQIDEAEDRLRAEYQAVASRPGYDQNSQQHRDFENRARQLQVARTAAVIDAKGQPQQIDTQEIARQVAWHQFQSEHHDVFNNQQAQTWAWGEYYKRKAEGLPDTKEAAEEILDAARRRFGMKPRRGVPAPDPATRQRFTGVGSRAGIGGGESLGKVQMGPHEKRMARIAFMKEGVSEAQAYQKWANGPGKELLKQKQRGG